MPYTNGTGLRTAEGRVVIYTDNNGSIEWRIGGSRSWRNNNPGNIIYGDWAVAHGAIGKDSGGFAIFPDETTGTNAKESLLTGKYGDYNSIREMLKGKCDSDGNIIPGTAYAPESDGNNPDLYADQIRKWTGLDVDNKKISDFTEEELQKLMDAMKRYEGWSPGSGFCKSADGIIIYESSLGFGTETLKKPYGATASFFDAAGNYVNPSPITFDLDGDGIETVALVQQYSAYYGDGFTLSDDAPVMFDHDGDGVKINTGWINADDGMLVLDRNSNGTIDNGTELFGDSTPLYAGGTAPDGFAAMVQEDTNADGVLNNLDTNWNSLRVWRDLNQDGISQAEELSTLDTLGITGINVAKTDTSEYRADGNIIKGTGTFIKTDGTTGNMADVWFKGDTFTSQFPDEIPVAEDVALLPQMEGSGLVRDLQQAAMH